MQALFLVVLWFFCLLVHLIPMVKKINKKKMILFILLLFLLFSKNKFACFVNLINLFFTLPFNLHFWITFTSSFLLENISLLLFKKKKTLFYFYFYILFFFFFFFLYFFFLFLHFLIAEIFVK